MAKVAKFKGAEYFRKALYKVICLPFLELVVGVFSLATTVTVTLFCPTDCFVDLTL